METVRAQQKIKQALKDILKKRAHTYADVAKVWDCSLPTVKRLLGNEELPLSRLLVLLDWLDVTLAEIDKLAQTDGIEAPRFTQRQLEFLAKNLREFAFLMKLYQDKTPQQIAKKHGLSPQILDKILIQLEKYDLIRAGPGGKVKTAHAQFPNIGGPLATATIKVQIDRMAQYSKIKIADNIAKRDRGMTLPPGEYSWTIAEVTEKSYLEFFNRVRREFQEFAAQSRLDSRIEKKPDVKTAVISFAAQLEEPTSPHLKIVSEIFDDYLSGAGG